MADQKMIFLPIASTSRFVTKKNIIDSESGNMRGGIRKNKVAKMNPYIVQKY